MPPLLCSHDVLPPREPAVQHHLGVLHGGGVPDHGRVQHVSPGPARPHMGLPCLTPRLQRPCRGLCRALTRAAPLSPEAPTWWGNRKQSPAEWGTWAAWVPLGMGAVASWGPTGCVLGQKHFHGMCPPCSLRPRGVCSQRHFPALVPPAEARPRAPALRGGGSAGPRGWDALAPPHVVPSRGPALFWKQAPQGSRTPRLCGSS